MADPSPPAETDNEGGSNTLLTCDLCQRVAFDSYESLTAHVDRSHADVAPDRPELLAMIEKIRPKVDEVLHSENSEMWRCWGEKTFAVAKERDGGPERLKEACDARAQLEEIVKRWNAGASVFIFGSSISMGLWDGLSDIDFIVVDVQQYELQQWPPNEKMAVRSLGTLLRRAGFSFQNLEIIEGARVPIIKHHAPSIMARLPSRTETTDVVSRSVRYLFDRSVSTSDRILFEGGVADAVGGVTNIEQLWWSPKGNTIGLTLKSRLDAVKVLTHQPCLVSAAVVHRSPLHDDIRPDIFGIDFDLGFRPFGVRNSELLRRCLMSHRCGRPGALVLKEWSKGSGVNNSMNGYLTSYAINILWIYYLMAKGHVPYLNPQDVPQSLKNATNKDPIYTPLVPSNLDEAGIAALHREMGSLLVGFFAFYCFEFDWVNHVVSLNRPGITTKAQLGWKTGDEVRLSRPGVGKNVRYTFCIEDPYEENLNLGRHIGECRWRKVQTEFHRAMVSLLKDTVEESSIFSWMANAGTEGQGKVAPTLQQLTQLMAIAVETIEATESLTVHEDVLKARFQKGAPEAYAAAISFYKWGALVQELGYHQSGKNVRARRNIGAKIPTKKSPLVQGPSSSAGLEKVSDATVQEAGSNQATSSSATAPSPTASPTAPPKNIVMNPIDLMTDQLIAEYISEHSKGQLPLQPEWLVWSGNGSEATIHMPGHRENTVITTPTPVKVSATLQPTTTTFGRTGGTKCTSLSMDSYQRAPYPEQQQPQWTPLCHPFCSEPLTGRDRLDTSKVLPQRRNVSFVGLGRTTTPSHGTVKAPVDFISFAVRKVMRKGK